MAVTSVYIWYMGDSAYDLRYVQSAVRNADNSGTVYFRKNTRQPLKVPDYDTFATAWQAALDAQFP